MLEFLFNKVAGLQDRFYFSLTKTLKNFINLLINYVLLRNVKCKVMLTGAYLEPSRTSMMEPFSLRLSQNVFNLIKLALGPFFTQLTLSWKNLQLWKLGEKKSFVNNRKIFFLRNLKLHSGMASSIKKASKISI